MSLNFCKNGNFNIFGENIFADDPRGTIKVWHGNISRNLILRLSKIHEIHENKAT